MSWLTRSWRTGQTCARCRLRFISTGPTSTEATAPPLLAKLRSEMKNAMKNKDTNRLSVLRAVLADVTNASKTNSPYKTDAQLLSLLKKRTIAAREAAAEFETASRDDLKAKELAQMAILKEYAGNVETLSEDAVTAAIQKVLGTMRSGGEAVNTGSVLKNLLGAGGELEGQPVDRAEVARLAKGMM